MNEEKKEECEVFIRTKVFFFFFNFLRPNIISNLNPQFSPTKEDVRVSEDYVC